MIVPETNPEYSIEPIGLMLEKTFIYNEKGKIIKMICHKCDYRLHSDKSVKDLIKEYYYYDNKLKKISEIGIDKFYTDFFYGKNKDLSLKQIDKNNRSKLTFSH